MKDFSVVVCVGPVSKRIGEQTGRNDAGLDRLAHRREEGHHLSAKYEPCDNLLEVWNFDIAQALRICEERNCANQRSRSRYGMFRKNLGGAEVSWLSLSCAAAFRFVLQLW